MSNELNERVTRLETVQQDHSKKLDSQAEKNETLTRLVTLVERQMEDSKEMVKRQEIRDEKQNKQMEDFGKVITKVNENLNNLNASQQQMQKEMNKIGERVTDIEQYQESSKIDTTKLVKSILSYIATGIGSIGIAVAIWYLTKK